MNPIIGTLVNGENNITTNQSFLFSFRIISGSLERQAKIVLLIDLMLIQGFWRRKERNFPLKRPSISGLFQILKKPARVGVIQFILSMKIIQCLVCKKTPKRRVTQKSPTLKITATNLMCIFANLSTIGFRLSCKDWSLIAIL